MENVEDLMDLIRSLPEAQVDLVTNLVLAMKGDDEKKHQVNWISTENAAEILGVTPATVRTYLMTGELDGRRISPRKLVVSSESVQRKRMAQTRF